MALLCWYMMVAKEISQALALHRGMVAIATGVTDIEARENPFTQILGEDLGFRMRTFLSISWFSLNDLRQSRIMHFKLNLVSSTRKILSYVLLIYRLLAAAMLVYVGSFFLVFTVNVTDLGLVLSVPSISHCKS